MTEGDLTGDKSSAERLLRCLDASDRLDIVERRLRKNGLLVAGLGVASLGPIAAGLLVSPLGFLGLLMIPQFLLPLLKTRRMAIADRREILHLLEALTRLDLGGLRRHAFRGDSDMPSQ